MKSLTVEDVLAIRREYKIVGAQHRNAVNVIELAQRFGVSQQTIRKIAKNHVYKDIADA